MLRPQSIVTFERCYLGAWGLGLVNNLMNWPKTVATMNANPQFAQLGPSFGITMMAGGIAIGAAITFLLWYFVARRGAAVAKWIVTVFFALTAIAFLFGLIAGKMAMTATFAVALVALVLQAVAVVMLFRPDTKEWFGELPPVEPTA